jgi:hypothetical protein
MRDRPSRRQDGLRGNMVSANESGFYLRETSLLSHNILSTGGVVTAGDVGQRTNLDVSRLLKGYCVLQVGAGYPIYPAPVRDSAKSGLGSAANRYLNYPVESVCVNTGGSYPDVKTSSLSMPEKSVGAAIVVRGGESPSQGEGPQEIDVSGYLITAIAPGIVWDELKSAGRERERDDKSRGNSGGRKPISGEPDALKGASPVRRRGGGNVPRGNAPCPYPTSFNLREIVPPAT